MECTKMKLEKIIKREDGSRVRIIASIYNSYQKIKYETCVHICEKGKRTWRGVYDTDNFMYRRLNTEDREKFILEAQLKAVTEDELFDAKLDLWNMIRPEL